MNHAVRNHGYFSMAFRPDDLVKYAERNLDGVDFDTFVGTGLSGGLVVPILAWHFKKFAFIIRKDNESSHSRAHQGTLGKRWIFVDDIIASGCTRNRVRKEIDDLIARVSNWQEEAFTEYVGTYLYQDGAYNRPNNVYEGKFVC